MTKTKLLAGGALALATAVVTGAHASTILLNLTDLGVYSADYDLTFVADDVTTQLNVGGYNLPAFVSVSNNAIFADGDSTNLLGPSWNFTPAAYGSDAFNYYDGTNVGGVAFGSVAIGEYDYFSQSFATTIGQIYHYDFHVENYSDPSGLMVSTGALAAPEPATWGLMLVGVGLAGAGLRRRRPAAA